MKVIKSAYLPTKLPIGFTIVVYLLLDKIKPVDWVYGAVYTLIGLIWFAAIVIICKEEHSEVVFK